MSFIEQAARIFGGTAEFAFQTVMFGRNALYIEGGAPVRIEGTEMIFKAGKTLITVTGEELSVRELSADCAAIVGRIGGFFVTEI